MRTPKDPVKEEQMVLDHDRQRMGDKNQVHGALAKHHFHPQEASEVCI
jgi:hypothetical protein